jgi:hypothetical protein
MFSLKIFLFILSISFVSSNEIYTRTQLRGLYHHNMNKLLNEEIQRIVERVVASAKYNGTSYSERYFIPNENNENNRYSLNTIILSKFSDKIIINRFKNILIDSNITISEPTCCVNYDGYICKIKFGVEICKFIYINW